MFYLYPDRHGGEVIISPLKVFGIRHPRKYVVQYYHAYGCKWCKGDEQIITFYREELSGLKRYNKIEDILEEHFEEFL